MVLGGEEWGPKTNITTVPFKMQMGTWNLVDVYLDLTLQLCSLVDHDLL